MAKQFTLGKNERLKSRKQIEQLFSEGKNISVFPFRIYFLLYPFTIHNSLKESLRTQFAIQFGVGVSGKNFKKAVDRNRIKRLIREAYRLQKGPLQNQVAANNQQLNLFFLYASKEMPDHKFIYDKMTVALQKTSSEIEKQPAK